MVMSWSWDGNPRDVFRPPQPHTWLGRAHWIGWQPLVLGRFGGGAGACGSQPFAISRSGTSRVVQHVVLGLNCPTSALPVLACPYSRFTPWPS